MIKAGVVGWPIAHSRSPLIHGHWLKQYQVDGSYSPIAVEPSAAAEFFHSLAERGLTGCNVTLPHKAAAFAAAEEHDASASAVGVANTLWLEQGRLHAANTDTHGFMRHLEVSAPEWRRHDGPAVVLGAGGAARAIVFGLLGAGVERILVYNRTQDRADALAAHFGSGAKVRAGEWSARAAGLSGASLLVNATSLGMVGNAPLDLDLDRLPHHATVADIVYAPLETELLASAQARGLARVDGLGMLLHQAVPGFERWFGVCPEVTAELRAIIVADLERT